MEIQEKVEENNIKINENILKTNNNDEKFIG